jgi:HK97 gp10 family phage protein
MTMKFADLGGLAAHILAVTADLKLAEEVCVEKACRMIEKEAKAAIGTYRYDWEPLKPETVARKARGDTPLLETGELRDSIEHVVMREGKEVVGYVGTNDPIAKYHEFGTRTIPPRPFLSAAAMRQEDKIHAMIVRTIAATFDRGGPHYRELREFFHVLHMLYHEGKKFAEDFLDDEDEQ